MSYSFKAEQHWLHEIEPLEKRELLYQLARAIRGAGNFNSVLLRLVLKADCENLNKLFNEYPNLVACAHAFSNDLVEYSKWQSIEQSVIRETNKT